MRDDWQVVKLPKCIRQVKIPKKVPRKSFLEEGEYPIVSQERDHINGYWDEAEHAIKVDRPLVAYGDHTQTVKYIDFDFVVGADGLKLFLTNDEVLPRYFYYYLLGNPVKGLGYARHYRLLKELDVHFPPLPEQERIVAILDKAFEGIDQAIAHTEQNLASARELFESYLNNIFTQRGDGWVENKLGDVCGITSSLVNPKEEQFQDLPHIGAGNMVSNSKELVDVMTAREEGLKSGKHTYTTDMVLYSKIRPYLMKVSVPDFEGLCSADVYPLMPKVDVVRREYLFYLLLTKDFTDYAISRSARAGMPKINRTCLFSYGASYPPLPEQDAILSKLNALNNHCKQLEALYTQKLESLKVLKQSLLQHAFAGELTKEVAA